MKVLGKIGSASLNIKNGILTFLIQVDYESGWCQVIVGAALDAPDPNSKGRIGTAYGCEMIRRLLLELRVNDFSEMAGRHIYVIGEGEGTMFKPTGLQSLLTDNSKSKAVIFSDIAKQFEITR